MSEEDFERWLGRQDFVAAHKRKFVEEAAMRFMAMEVQHKDDCDRWEAVDAVRLALMLWEVIEEEVG